MSDFPDFSPQGYQVMRELGRNASGGRVVYLCETLAEPIDRVVIKQFQFARGSGWSQFKEIEREMQVLKDLEHSGIPRYIGSIQTDDGYSIVQEFKDAQALSIPRSFDPDQIKQIAVAVLEILVYLQARIPVVIHRDIKPENVLVDVDLNVYLIDFGFARIGGGEVAMSSVAAGTFGFMAPEQMYNKGLSAATDLYGLGAMLIALLTQTKSTKMDALIDEDGRITFQHLTPKLSLSFIKWLEKMVAPRVSDRYPDAETALAALQPIYVSRSPTVKLSQSTLVFVARKLGEKITQTIAVSNHTDDTLLQGHWSIEPHPHDRSQTDRHHKWISLSSREFTSNQIQCDITVDTSKLAAQSVGTRTIVLHSNAVPDTHTIRLEIETAPLPLQVKKLPYLAICIFPFFAFGCVYSLLSINDWGRFLSGTLAGGITSGGFAIFSLLIPANHAAGINVRAVLYGCTGGVIGLITGGIVGGIGGSAIGSTIGLVAGGINVAQSLSGAIVGVQAMLGSALGGLVGVLLTILSFGSFDIIIACAIVGVYAGVIANLLDFQYAKLPESRKYQQGFILILLQILSMFGISFGICLVKLTVGGLIAAIGSGATLIYLVLYLPSKAQQQIAAYRQKQQHLLKL